MKAAYIDNFGPWVMMFVSAVAFLSALDGFQEGGGNQLVLGIGAGGFFLIIALRRFWDVHQAKRERRDSAIFGGNESDR